MYIIRVSSIDSALRRLGGGRQLSCGDTRHSPMLSTTLPAERGRPRLPFTLSLIRRGPQADGAWLTGSSDERLLISVDALLVRGKCFSAFLQMHWRLQSLCCRLVHFLFVCCFFFPFFITSNFHVEKGFEPQKYWFPNIRATNHQSAAWSLYFPNPADVNLFHEFF